MNRTLRQGILKVQRSSFYTDIIVRGKLLVKKGIH